MPKTSSLEPHRGLGMDRWTQLADKISSSDSLSENTESIV